MAPRKTKQHNQPHPSWADEKLVHLCLQGSEAAWGALVDKYEKLVYAVVCKYGAAPEEASDLFQAIWLDIYNDLPQLRNRNRVKPWLISLTRNKCYHWKQERVRRSSREIDTEQPSDLERMAVEEAGFVEDLERDQLVREAILALPERCREMVRLLFFAQPPMPYAQVAERLGLATGSIGFIRGRCLKKLQAALESLGLSAREIGG
ncbi:MAG: sigma-70 family RNA polymerase sigma factor [Holophagales bacterium]|nr:sigma-70 family RNA polymerase sigma factor [Holophagales bacterium]